MHITSLCEDCEHDCKPISRVEACASYSPLLPNVCQATQQAEIAVFPPKISILPRSEVLFFVERMECKLRANDHKQHWRDFKIEYLMRRLKEEVAELEDSIKSGGTCSQRADEAADVANFAMMIADSLTQPCGRTERNG